MMKISKELKNLLSYFNKNWEDSDQSRLFLGFDTNEILNIGQHPLKGELTNLINEQCGSLPYFKEKEILWCTMASSPNILQTNVQQLQAWILPSYGWQGDYIPYESDLGDFQQAISKISPTNYFRWHSSIDNYLVIEKKLAMKYQLGQNRPERIKKGRPSLYELRTKFQTFLMLGDRDSAKKTIKSIDDYELDKAFNTQMMRIRLWHHFRDFEEIKNYHKLKDLKDDPNLPESIRECIREVTGETKKPIEENAILQRTKEEVEINWERWFEFILDQDEDNIEVAKQWLLEKNPIIIEKIKQTKIEEYSEHWDSIFINDDLIEKHKPLIKQGLGVFLGDFVREPDFPRSNFVKLYLSLLRLWSKLYSGVSTEREHGHVLLELAHAIFSHNHEINEVKKIIEDWWDARAVPSQLTFALDAIELLSNQHPDAEAASNLWINAADIAKRNSQGILESEKNLWRRVGEQIGFDDNDISQYFPIEEKKTQDPLRDSNLNKITIVCMREQQASSAAKIIETRTGAEVSVVSKKVAGNETTQALSSDIILFVWMATTHAIFRAFDGFDRSKLCYVQGTGIASIIRALERWCMETNNNSEISN